MRRTLRIWLPLALLAIALSGMLYLVVQQVVRAAAEEPQLQLARQAADELDRGATAASVASGPTVDLRTSAAPMTVVTDRRGAILAGTGLIDGAPVAPPDGVLAAARGGEVDRVTWQPAAGVRLAQVTVGWRNGAVTVARSLAETERVKDQLLVLVAVGLGGTLVALALVAAAVAHLVGPDGSD